MLEQGSNDAPHPKSVNPHQKLPGDSLELPRNNLLVYEQLEANKYLKGCFQSFLLKCDFAPPIAATILEIKTVQYLHNFEVEKNKMKERQ